MFSCLMYQCSAPTSLVDQVTTLRRHLEARHAVSAGPSDAIYQLTNLIRGSIVNG